MFLFRKDRLIFQDGNETLSVEGYGRDGLRVRAALEADFPDQGIVGPSPEVFAKIRLIENGAEISNGKLTCRIHQNGWLSFYEGEKLLIKEYYRDFSGANEHSPSMKVRAREYRSHGSDYRVTLRFEAQEEKLFGMGQYQQPNLDLKGCILELAQRNSQTSVPFLLSSRGYGFLLCHAGTGEAMFGANFTQWRLDCADGIDYLVIAGKPKELLERYTELAGRAPEFPEEYLGLWQSKLRYRTQEEVLSVAREYHRRGIPLDVIVIDFFHWVRQGDWAFDPVYFPDPDAMTRELHEMGTKCFVSVWTTVDRKSVNFEKMRRAGMLVRTERGSMQCFDFQGDTVVYDATNERAREFLFERLKENYLSHGIDGFWLDEAEPEYAAYDFDHFRYRLGPAQKTGSLYPRLHAQGVYEGMRGEGIARPVSLIRSAFVGSQKYGALLWSGDILSNFASLRDQLSGGLNVGLAGIPWWTTDTGGFFGDVTAEGFSELLIRWFEFSCFSPVLRLHGDRGPHDIPNLSDLDYRGGFSPTGRDNELWSFGEETFEILKKYVLIRLSLKPYLKRCFKEASDLGSPVIRPLFYEFPGDARAWETDDEYLLGPDLLVAPVLERGQTVRSVYLPAGKWKAFRGEEIYEGGKDHEIAAPLDFIPVFERLEG